MRSVCNRHNIHSKLMMLHRSIHERAELLQTILFETATCLCLLLIMLLLVHQRTAAYTTLNYHTSAGEAKMLVNQDDSVHSCAR